MESPSSAVASRVASTKSAQPGPAACSISSFSSAAGNGRSGFRVKSPVMTSWLLTTARERSALILDKASKSAVTTKSQPRTASALPAEMRTA